MMPVQAPRRARRQSLHTCNASHHSNSRFFFAFDFVFERVTRDFPSATSDEDLITDARLKLKEITLETRAVVVGRAQGAQGERVLNRYTKVYYFSQSDLESRLTTLQFAQMYQNDMNVKTCVMVPLFLLAVAVCM